MQIFKRALFACTIFGAVFAHKPALTADTPASPVARDQQVELAMKIKPSFTFAAVGDLLVTQPFSKIAEPEIQSLVAVLRRADVTVANMESTIIDLEHYTGTKNGYFGGKDVADDLANMGIDMVNKANNHTFGSGEEGLWETFQQLERVGIVHVGAGRNLTEARAPKYFQSTKGRVGMVGIYPLSNNINNVSLAATYPVDGFGARPGANALHLRTYHGVTEAQMAQLRGMHDAIMARRSEVPNPVKLVPPADGTLQLFDTFFKVSARHGDLSYEMDRTDLRDILRNIKTGKQFSDFMIANVHWHQNRFQFQTYSYDHYPADFEIAFAHQAIENGADAVVGHGVHTLKGIEIYKGRPIFYGLSNYAFQAMLAPQPSSNRETDGGIGEINEIRQGAYISHEVFEALLVTGRYEDGRLSEVRIYPVDLGSSRPGSQLGVPRTPSHDVAHRILAAVQEYSKPFGTVITIDNGVGIIRVRPDATSAITPTVVHGRKW